MIVEEYFNDWLYEFKAVYPIDVNSKIEDTLYEAFICGMDIHTTYEYLYDNRLVEEL